MLANVRSEKYVAITKYMWQIQKQIEKSCGMESDFQFVHVFWGITCLLNKGPNYIFQEKYIYFIGHGI